MGENSRYRAAATGESARGVHDCVSGIAVTSVLAQLNKQVTFLGFIYEKQWFPSLSSPRLPSYI